MKTLITVIAAMLIAPAAHAWGDREQGALAGLIIGTIISNQNRDASERPPVVSGGPQIIIAPNHPHHRHPPIYVPPVYDSHPPVYIPPQPRVCHQYPHYDQYGYLRGWRMICR